jgi:basic amino acid/polyamine antiporter, APA family
MAQDGLAFRWLARIHPRFHTPARALWIQAAWSCALVATGTYRALFTRVVYTEWIFFALMSVGLIKVRRASGSALPHRFRGYPWVQIVFAAAALIVAAISIAADPWQAATGLFLVVLGLPVYYLWLKNADH